MTIEEEEVDLFIKRIGELCNASIYDDFDDILAGRYERSRRRNTCYDKRMPKKVENSSQNNKSTDDAKNTNSNDKRWNENISKELENEIQERSKELDNDILLKNEYLKFFRNLLHRMNIDVNDREKVIQAYKTGEFEKVFKNNFSSTRPYIDKKSLEKVWKTLQKDIDAYIYYHTL